LARDQDIPLFYQGSASHVFPDYWEDLSGMGSPKTERTDHGQRLLQTLTGDDEICRMHAAKAPGRVWKGRCATAAAEPPGRGNRVQ